MHNVSVSDLKNNPSVALRQAKLAPVVVMNRNEPDAIILSFEQSEVFSAAGTKAAVATELFRDGGLSLARSAKLAGMSLSAFVTHVSRLGIPVVNQTPQKYLSDMQTLDRWLVKAA